jgi:hypothetical protein
MRDVLCLFSVQFGGTRRVLPVAGQPQARIIWTLAASLPANAASLRRALRTL